MATLFVVENVSSQIMNCFNECEQDAYFFLTSPEAVFAFNGKNIKKYTTEDFVGSQELNKLGMKNIDRNRLIVSIVDEFIKRMAPKIEKYNLNFALYHFDRFKIILDSITSRILILDRIIRQLDPKEIVCQKSGTQHVDIELYFNKESIYSLLIPILAAYYQIPIRNYPVAESNQIDSEELKSNFKAMVRNLMLRHYGFWAKIRNCRIRNTKKESIIFSIDPIFDQKVIIRNPDILKNYEILTCKKEANIFSTNSIRKIEPIKHKGLTSFENIDLGSIVERLESLCTYRNVNWYPIFQARLNYFIQKIVPRYFSLYLYVKKVLDEVKPSIALSNGGVNNIWNGTILRAVKDCKIPHIMVQHGGGGYGLINVPAVLFRDFEQVRGSHYIMWGDKVKETFAHNAQKNNVTIHSAGSSIIRNIIDECKKQSKNQTQHIEKIFYICQNLTETQNAFYYPGGVSHYSDTWYFKLHLKMIETFKKYNSYKVTFKVPPTFKKIKLYKKVVGDDKHLRVKNKPLLKCIHEPDLFILDSLSTSIIQCSATKKPIIVYTGEHCKIPNQMALDSLRKRAICCETEEIFLKTVDDILNYPDDISNKFDADPSNDEFINLFGTGGLEKEPSWKKIFNEIIQNNN